MTSAGNIFRCSFLACALRVKCSFVLLYNYAVKNQIHFINTFKNELTILLINRLLKMYVKRVFFFIFCCYMYIWKCPRLQIYWLAAILLSADFTSLLFCVCVCGGGGGAILWYFRIYVASDYFWGFIILNFDIFFFSGWGVGVGAKVRRINIFGGMKILWIFLGVITNWIGLWVIFMHFRFFLLKSMYNMGIFFGLLKFQIFFWGMPDIPYIFLGVNSRCSAQAYVWRKNESTPPLGQPSPTPTYTILFKKKVYVFECFKPWRLKHALNPLWRIYSCFWLLGA